MIDLQLSRPEAGLSTAREHQLRAQALTVSTRAFGRPVRAGTFFLDGGTTPTWLPGLGPSGALTDADHHRTERELAALASRFAEARFRDHFEGVPERPASASAAASSKPAMAAKRENPEQL